MKTEVSLLQPGVTKLKIRKHDIGDSEALTFRDFFEHCDDESFSAFISGDLIDTKYDGFFWELPPMTTESIDREFECVVVDGPVLSTLTANPGPFSNQFSNVPSGQSIAVFENLGRDALLISPLPVSGEDHSPYPHLAAFLRLGPEKQVAEFWRALGSAALNRVTHTPFWLSTAGLGVSWLHLLIDSRPKYYRFQPYKSAGSK